MSARPPIERRLPTILADLSAGPYPDYTDALLARTASARQRPGWAFPERWLPVSTLTSATATLPRFPWRLVAIVALLIVALAVGAVLIASPRPQPLPAPFGPAGNGLVTYSTNGDIYAADPATGQATAIVTGADADTDPVFSRDGTHIAFRRQAASVSGQVSFAASLYVVRPDGSGLTTITPEPMRHGLQQYSFSPDGSEVVFVGNGMNAGDLYIAKADGTAVRPLDVGMPASGPSYRPPDGQQIAFSGAPNGDLNELGLYVVDTDGTGVRNLVEPSSEAAAVHPLWSPDGTRIAYTTVDMTTPWGWLGTHTMMADGSRQRPLPTPPESFWDYLGGWSNDGTRLVVIRGYSADGSGAVAAAIVPADGSGTGVETDHQSFIGNDSEPQFAPDDGSVLVIRPNWDAEPGAPVYVDPTTGVARSAPFAANKASTWQRVAPSQ